MICLVYPLDMVTNAILSCREITNIIIFFLKFPSCLLVKIQIRKETYTKKKMFSCGENVDEKGKLHQFRGPRCQIVLPYICNVISYLLSTLS